MSTDDKKINVNEDKYYYIIHRIQLLMDRQFILSRIGKNDLVRRGQIEQIIYFQLDELKSIHQVVYYLSIRLLEVQNHIARLKTRLKAKRHKPLTEEKRKEIEFELLKMETSFKCIKRIEKETLSQKFRKNGFKRNS